MQNPEFAYPFRRRVGLVFQNPDVQLFSPTVFDEVAFGPLQLQWPKEKVRAAVEEMLEVMKITHLQGPLAASFVNGREEARDARLRAGT